MDGRGASAWSHDLDRKEAQVSPRDQARSSPKKPVESEPSAGTGDPASEQPAVRIRGEALAQISTELVQLHSRYYGKGPTKAKTYMVNDTVICMLKEGFTTVEETLIEEGKIDSVYQMRRTFQDVMEEQFKGVVERATGRKVIAYLSQIHHDPAMAVELFVLEPVSGMIVGEHELDLAGS